MDDSIAETQTNTIKRQAVSRNNHFSKEETLGQGVPAERFSATKSAGKCKLKHGKQPPHSSRLAVG